MDKTKVVTTILAACLTCIMSSGMAHAGSEKDAWINLVGEKFSNRPEFEFVQNNPALPNVLIYGDSISMGYTPRVRVTLKNKANVYRIYCNGGGVARPSYP